MNPDTLDTVLAGWAAARRLPDDRADHVLQTILATPAPAPVHTETSAGLPPSWWADFGAHLSDLMVRATGTLVPA